MDSLPEAIIRPDAHHICIDAEAEMEQQSPKTMTESSMVLMDEEDLDDDDIDEEDLDIGTEIDPDSPPWDMYGEPEIDDIDDSNEETTLLRTKAARTEIIVTPISPVSSSHDLARLGHSTHAGKSSDGRMDFLSPDMQPQQLLQSEDI